MPFGGFLLICAGVLALLLLYRTRNKPRLTFIDDEFFVSTAIVSALALIVFATGVVISSLV